MKRFFVILIAICSLVSLAMSESNDAFFPFQISNSDTYEEVQNKLIALFGEGELRPDNGNYLGGYYVIDSDDLLLGIQLETVAVKKEDDNSWEVFVELDLSDLNSAAEKIKGLYDKLCELYGEPSQDSIYNYDLNGNKELYNIVLNIQDLQASINYFANLKDESKDLFDVYYTWRYCIMSVIIRKDIQRNITIRWYKLK